MRLAGAVYLVIGILVVGVSWYINHLRGDLRLLLFQIVGVIFIFVGLIKLFASRGKSDGATVPEHEKVPRHPAHQPQARHPQAMHQQPHPQQHAQHQGQRPHQGVQASYHTQHAQPQTQANPHHTRQREQQYSHHTQQVNQQYSPHHAQRPQDVHPNHRQGNHISQGSSQMGQTPPQTRRGPFCPYCGALANHQGSYCAECGKRIR